jgi:hypothetical protein
LNKELNQTAGETDISKLIHGSLMEKNTAVGGESTQQRAQASQLNNGSAAPTLARPYNLEDSLMTSAQMETYIDASHFLPSQMVEPSTLTG